MVLKVKSHGQWEKTIIHYRANTNIAVSVKNEQVDVSDREAVRKAALTTRTQMGEVRKLSKGMFFSSI